jgi:hypothetical protein
MSQSRELALSIALEAVLSAARSLYVDVDELRVGAFVLLMIVPSNVSPAVAQAIDEIDEATNLLDYKKPS